MINGELAQAGNSKDISGDPVQSIVELCELLQAQGLEVKPGDIILAGAATQAVALESKMEVKLNVQGLPSAFLKVGAE
jgi:2-oxo-3-hexenedioate decarboxylase